MADMSFNEALQVVSGVVRFQRSLDKIRETLELAVLANSQLARLDSEIAQKEFKIAETQKALDKITDTLAAQDMMLSAALEKVKLRAEREYADILAEKAAESASLNKTIMIKKKEVVDLQDTIHDLEGKVAQARDKVETEQEILDSIKLQKAELAAKLS